MRARTRHANAHVQRNVVCAGAHLPVLLPREATPWTSQFATLFRRTLKEQWRKRGMLATQVRPLAPLLVPL